MALTLAENRIEAVSIIDDDTTVRESLSDPILDLNLEPVLEAGPLADIEGQTRRIIQVSQAALCDHHLKKKAYSHYNGAQLVARLYESQFPAVLCTNWDVASIDEIRPYRRFIPSLIRPSGDPELLRRAIELCLREFKGEFATVRKPWRALVRVTEIDNERSDGYVFVTIPSWSAEVIRLDRSRLPVFIQADLAEGKRFHAQVNLGAEKSEDVFLDSWEES